MPDPIRTTEAPADRLGRIAAAMSDALEAHPENVDADVDAIVFLTDVDDNACMSALLGYDSDEEAIVDGLMHLKAVLRTSGRTLEVIGIPNDASALDDDELDT